MKIYTKTGDKGETGLFGSDRVSKDSKRIEAYGTVDELSSVLGVVRSMNPAKEVDGILETVQAHLFVLGADLATPNESGSSVPRLGPSNITGLEHHIDALEQKLKPLKNFIFPGGSQIGAMLHFARTVCRRAERRVVKLSKKEDVGEQPLIYLNRLADLLFVLARYANQLEDREEHRWTK